MTRPKKSAKKSVKLPDGRVAAGRGPAKGAPNAGRPASEVKAALLAGFSNALPELLRLAASAKSEGDRVRALDVLGKYAGLTSIEVEVSRPVSLVIEGLE